MALVDKHGFSVLELLAVLALIAILCAFAIPRWNQLLAAFSLDSSVRQIQSDLHNIKMRAAAENVGFQLAYLEGASAYTIQRESEALTAKALPQGIVIAKAGSVAFSPRGTAGANRVRLRHPAGLCKQVVVSATGRVRVCKPNSCTADC